MAHLPGLAFDLGETITMLRDSVQQFADDAEDDEDDREQLPEERGHRVAH